MYQSLRTCCCRSWHSGSWDHTCMAWSSCTLLDSTPCVSCCGSGPTGGGAVRLKHWSHLRHTDHRSSCCKFCRCSWSHSCSWHRRCTHLHLESRLQGRTKLRDEIRVGEQHPHDVSPLQQEELVFTGSIRGKSRLSQPLSGSRCTRGHTELTVVCAEDSGEVVLLFATSPARMCYARSTIPVMLDFDTWDAAV